MLILPVIDIATGRKPNETWGDSSDEDSDISSHTSETAEVEGLSTSSHEDSLKSLMNAIASLMKFSILVRSSATRDDYIKAASRYGNWSAYPDIGHVREKYGRARYSKPWLLERLGQTITRRRQFLKYRVEHHNKMIEERKEFEDDDEITAKVDKTVASTKATTFIGDDKTKQRLQKPAMDFSGSVGSVTSYDPTVFGADGMPALLTVPPPPKEAFADVPFVYGEPFQCPYCFTEQVVKHKAAWK